MLDVYVVTGTMGPTVEPTNVRRYYLQAEKVEWDYAPLGLDNCGSTPQPFSDEQAFNTIHLNGTDNSDGFARIGTKYLKARYIGCLKSINSVKRIYLNSDSACDIRH